MRADFRTDSLKEKAMKNFRGHKKVVLLAIGAAAICLAQATFAQAITGDITFAGSVSLNTSSANTATTVTAWHGLAPGDLPQVQSVDGTFASFVNPGDGTTFHAPWSFNSGPVSSFWSVDGFTFDLTSSTITNQANGSVSVIGTGQVSHMNFTTTPGTWSFTTQDPSANSRFSFSAASAAVPEPGAAALFAVGGVCFAALSAKRKKRFYIG
jgi:hypothetical protein